MSVDACIYVGVCLLTVLSILQKTQWHWHLEVFECCSMFVCDVVSAVRSSAILDCTIQISLIFRLCSLRTTIIICSHTKFIYLHKFHSFFQKTKQNKNETQTNWKMNEMPLLWNRFMFIVHLWSLWIVVLFMLVATREMCKNWRRNNEIKQKMQANSSILIIAREKSAYNLFTLRLFLF